MAAGIFLSALFGSMWQGLGGDEDSLGEYAYIQIGLWIGLVGIVVLAARRKGSGSVVRDFGLRGVRGDIPKGIGAGAAAWFLLPLVALALRPLLGKPDISEPARDLVDRADGAGFVVLMLFTIVGAAVIEELFFRGLLLRSLQKRFSVVPSVILSAIAFGLAHQPDVDAEGLVVVMVSLTLFGAGLAVLAVRSGRLGPGILAHATFNAMTIVYLAAR